MAKADAEDTPPSRIWVLLGDYIALAGEQLVRDGLNRGSPCRYRDAWGNLHSGDSLPGGFWLDCAINREEHSAKRRERIVPRDPVADYFAIIASLGRRTASSDPSPPARDRVIPAVEIYCVELLVPCAEKSVVEPAVLAEAAPAAEPPTPVEAAPMPTGDMFYTGGRSSAARLVKQEAARRISDGEVTPRYGGLNRFARELGSLWEEKRQSFTPPGPSMSIGTIENIVRETWNARLSKT
jgi:hypothetical protein